MGAKRLNTRNVFQWLNGAKHVSLATAVLAVFLPGLFILTGHASQALALDSPFEGAPKYGIADVLNSRIRKSPCFSVRDNLKVSGIFIEFQMETRFGLVEVPSLELMKIRQRETENICRTLKENSSKKDDDFYKLLDSSLKNGRFNDSPVAKNGAPEGASLWRHVALGLGIDPYTSNPIARAFLEETVQAISEGTLTSKPTLKAIPGGDPTVLDFASLDSETALKLQTLNPEGVESYNYDKLLAMGVPEGTARAFTSDTGLTPTHKTLIVYYMGLMKGVANLKNVLSPIPIGEISSESIALFFVKMAGMLAKYHREGATVKEIMVTEGIPVALDESGVAVAMLPVDVFYYSEDNSGLLDSLSALAGGKNVKSVELVIPGKVTPEARSQIKLRGITLMDEVPRNKETARRP
jgi:hypothetical protein